MSTVHCNTVQTSSGGPVTLTKQQAAKAWVNFNGVGTVSVRSSLNHASLTDNATGDYTTSFTSSFANNDYTIGGTTRHPGTASGGVYQGPHTNDSDQATGSLRAYTITAGNAVADMQYCFPVFIGDLA